MAPDEASPAEVTFHNEKSTLHRVIHVDGAMGSVTPRGDLIVAVYNERFPYPKTITRQLVDGNLGPEGRGAGREGVFREIEASLVMTGSVAREIHTWLGKKLEELDALTTSTDRQNADDHSD